MQSVSGLVLLKMVDKFAINDGVIVPESVSNACRKLLHLIQCYNEKGAIIKIKKKRVVYSPNND